MSPAVKILVVAILAILGGLPTLYLVGSVPAVIAYKLYRKVRLGISIWD